jgi:hypothetical protein
LSYSVIDVDQYPGILRTRCRASTQTGCLGNSRGKDDA